MLSHADNSTAAHEALAGVMGSFHAVSFDCEAQLKHEAEAITQKVPLCVCVSVCVCCVLCVVCVVGDGRQADSPACDALHAF